MYYQFEHFCLDANERCIRVKGALVPCDTRIIHLCALLIKHYPEVLSTQQILREIWPRTVVSNWSVSRLIADTRAFFKAHDFHAAMIQTVRGKGYRITPEFAELVQAFADKSQRSEHISRPQHEPQAQPLTPSRSDTLNHSQSNRSNVGLVARAALLLMLAIPGIWLIADTFHQTQHNAERQPPTLLIGEDTEVVGRVLWVDDNPSNNMIEKRMLERHQVAVYTVTNTEEALLLLSMYNYHAVISDMGRHGDSLAGLKLLQIMREQGIQTPFVLYTLLESNQQNEIIAEYGGQAVATRADDLFKYVTAYLPAQ